MSAHFRTSLILNVKLTPDFLSRPETGPHAGVTMEPALRRVTVCIIDDVQSAASCLSFSLNLSLPKRHILCRVEMNVTLSFSSPPVLMTVRVGMLERKVSYTSLFFYLSVNKCSLLFFLSFLFFFIIFISSFFLFNSFSLFTVCSLT